LVQEAREVELRAVLRDAVVDEAVEFDAGELLLWPWMECAALLSYLVTRAFEPIPNHRFQEYRVRPFFVPETGGVVWQQSITFRRVRWWLVCLKKRDQRA
jgi:hypothetical protein